MNHHPTLKITKRVLAILSLTLPVLIFYQNCQRDSSTSSSVSSSRYVAPYGLPAINYFQEPPPPLICGKNGWAFLLRNYVSQHCGSCHYTGSFAPVAFADSNLTTAYTQAQWISQQNWHTFTTKNTFCFPNCDIVPEGEVYHGIMEWFANKTCP